jgi:hypothetical protein
MVDRVARALAVGLEADEPRLNQDLQVLRNGRLGELEMVDTSRHEQQELAERCFRISIRAGCESAARRSAMARLSAQHVSGDSIIVHRR